MQTQKKLTTALTALALATGVTSAAQADPVRFDPIDSPWFLSVDAGMPRLESDNLKAIGSLELGYQMETLGFEARGSASAYDFVNEERIAESQSLDGSAEGWYRSGKPGAKFRFELRLAGGGAYYDSTYIGALPGQTLGIDDETSSMGRGSGQMGFSWRGGGALSGTLRLGGGVQYESYNALSGLTINDSESFSFRGLGDLRVRAKLIPDSLSLRLRANGSTFGITRSRIMLGVSSAGATSEETTESFQQTEISARLFVDIDELSFVGILPALFGGFDYVSVGDNSESVSTFIPVGGLAVIRPFF